MTALMVVVRGGSDRIRLYHYKGQECFDDGMAEICFSKILLVVYACCHKFTDFLEGVSWWHLKT